MKQIFRRGTQKQQSTIGAYSELTKRRNSLLKVNNTRINITLCYMFCRGSSIKTQGVYLSKPCYTQGHNKILRVTKAQGS
jgi:hypothetical protein